MKYAVTEHSGYVRVDFRTNPTLEMVMEIQQLVSLGYPGQRRLYCLNEYRFLFTVPELQQIAEHALGFPHPPDRVAIVTNHPASFETARVHRHYRAHGGTDEAIFHFEDEAIRWLRAPSNGNHLDQASTG